MEKFKIVIGVLVVVCLLFFIYDFLFGLTPAEQMQRDLQNAMQEMLKPMKKF